MRDWQPKRGRAAAVGAGLQSSGAILMERGSSGEGGEEDGEALEQLRFVFDLCDRDEDGIISVDEFRRIGRDHFDKTKVIINL